MKWSSLFSIFFFSNLNYISIQNASKQITENIFKYADIELV